MPALADDSQSELRLNPEIDTLSAHVPYTSYSFLKPAANSIELNGDDWSALAQKFAAAQRGDSLFSVVYLGDSHVQADFGGSVLRHRLQEESRSAGRGLVIPFLLASTNQPKDYAIGIDAPYESSKLLKMPWLTDMPFTGIGLKLQTDRYKLTLSASTPFDRLGMVYLGEEPDTIFLRDCYGNCLSFSRVNEEGLVKLELDTLLTEVTADIATGSGTTTFGGFTLLADTVGTVVHSIGNNGATYSSYGFIDGFSNGLAVLRPDIIIIALGTNEAFGRNSPDVILSGIEAFVTTVRQHNPQSKIVLVGPAECYKKTYRRVRNKKGRWRRVSSRVVNQKVLAVRNVIKGYAAKEGIPYYDHYEAFGGTGAAAKLKAAHLLGKDGIHYTVEGYRLCGDMLADALLRSLYAGTSADSHEE